MKKLSFLILMIFSFCALGFSQHSGQGRQIGVVSDEEGNPLEGVTIKLVYPKTGSGFEIITDAEGKWVAMGVKGGTWHLDFTLQGYAPKNISWTILDFRQKNKLCEVTLQKLEGMFITDDLQDEFQEGVDQYEQGKYQESIDIFNGILETFPDAYMANMNIGNCYFQMEKYEEAEKFYLLFYERDQENADVLLGIGNCYANRGDNDTALEWYNRIEFEKIRAPVVLYNVGTIFFNNAQYENAIKYYKRAVEIKEDFTDAVYQLGLTNLTVGSNQDAIIQFENYLKLDSDSERSTQVKGFIEYLKKQ